MREIKDISIGELMSKPAVTVTPETTIKELTDLMATFEYNAFPVVDDANILQGLVSRRDLFKLYLLPYHKFIPSLEDTWISSVGAIMSRGVIVLYSHEPAIKAIALMVERGVRTIPIVSETQGGSEVVGVVTRSDLAVALKP